MPVERLHEVLDGAPKDADLGLMELETFAEKLPRLLGPHHAFFARRDLGYTGAGVTVSGLVIDSFSGAGVRLTSIGATGDWIYGNFLGTDPTGTQPEAGLGTSGLMTSVVVFP